MDSAVAALGARRRRPALGGAPLVVRLAAVFFGAFFGVFFAAFFPAVFLAEGFLADFFFAAPAPVAFFFFVLPDASSAKAKLICLLFLTFLTAIQKTPY